MKFTPRAWVNLGLIAAISVLALVVIYEPGKKTETKLSLSTLNKTDVKKIHVQRQAQEDIVLERGTDGWIMSTPYQYPANDFKVDSLLQLLTAEPAAQYDMAQLNQNTYGLDKPVATITINDEHRFIFGGSESLQHRRYLRYQDKLNLIVDTFYYQIAAPANGFLNHAIIPGSKSFTKVELPKLTLSLIDGKWQAQPSPKDLSADQITALLDNWRFAQALQVNAYTGKPLSNTIRIYREGEKLPLEFALIQNKDTFVLIRQDLKLQFSLAAEKATDLLQLPARQEEINTSKPPAGNSSELPKPN